MHITVVRSGRNKGIEGCSEICIQRKKLQHFQPKQTEDDILTTAASNKLDGVYKTHTGEQGVKEQLWAQVAPPNHTCKACTSWRWGSSEGGRQWKGADHCVKCLWGGGRWEVLPRSSLPET